MQNIKNAVLSILLAVALILPMSTAAFAASEAAAAVRLSASQSVLYLHAGQTPSATITATAEPADYTGTITWSVVGNAALLENNALFNQPAAYGSNRSIVVRPAGYAADGSARTGAVTIRATLQGAGGAVVQQDVDVTIREDTLGDLTLTVSPDTIPVGGAAQAGVSASYQSGIALKPSEVEYSSSDADVAKVSSSGAITGVSAGRATITAKAEGKTASKTVTVASSNLTDTAQLGTDLSLRKIYNELNARYIAQYSSGGNAVYPSGSATVAFAIPSSSENFGLLRDGARRVVMSGDSYPFGQLESMYLESYAEGVFTFSCVLRDGDRSLREDVSIRINTPTKHIRVEIGSDSDYSFSADDNNGTTGAQSVGNTIGSFNAIRFGSILSGENTGTLYTSSAMTSDARVGGNTVVTAGDVEKLYFSPSRSGTYRIAYQAYANETATGNPLCSGELIIAVDAASLDVVVNLDSVKAYTFFSEASGGSSAYNLLTSAINGALGRSMWSYLKFDGAGSATNPIGTLHESSTTLREIASSDYIAYSNIASLYFVPTRAGTYEIAYGVYADDTGVTPLVTGKLRIVVSSVPTGAADVFYTTSANGRVALDENDFIRFYRAKRGSRYSLAYVVFTDYTGEGAFRHDSSVFVPYNSADYYTRAYSGQLSANPRYLDRVSFTAPASSGFTAVKFTCYGGAGSASANVAQEGVLYIFYTAADVPSVTYTAYGVASVTLAESDFVSAYKTATKSAAAAPQFSIRLLTAPAYGLLYYRPTASGNATRLTEGSLGNYTFYANGGNSRNAIATLSYTPLNTSASSDSIVYAAYDSDGAQLYTGTIRFKLAADRVMNAPADGLAFSLTDFYSLGDSDPVVAVAFREPESGKLYALQNNRPYAADSSTRFYTISNADGSYPVTALRYTPKYGATGSTTLNYVAYRRSGASFENSLIVNVTNKTASARFTDVTATSSSWAAGSVDFAYNLGLVNGTETNPPKFSPSSTMRRCDLVLILYRLAGEPAVGGTLPYTDVSAGDYYYNSALWAYRNNIMNGVVTGGVYDPAGAITRQDFATILYNYTNLTGVSTANNGSLLLYTDAAQVSSYARNAVTWAVANGYITSTSSGYTLEPARTATRAEISTLLHRYLTY